jgi:glutamine amidotransferase
MGWNRVIQVKTHPLFKGIESGSRFYFVHSYFVKPQDSDVQLARTEYGVPFTSAVVRDNIAAVQFHPEKSAACGLALLANFVRWNA